jgi:hypothetical protein
MSREKYSLLEIVKNRGISQKMYRSLSREINDKKEEKRRQKLIESLQEVQEDK